AEEFSIRRRGGMKKNTRNFFFYMQPNSTMSSQYSQRSLTVLALLGILSAIMSVLSVILIFQLQGSQAGTADTPPRLSGIPAEVSAVLRPVSTVLTALALTLSLSSVVVCLLHSYFTAEICGGEDDTDRADWFLLDSRPVRHVAIGLFCLGISVYLA
uniref:Transmembrane protein 221 n=1 Tax=Lepisosteus oculatus TaxID=7918 RepID=W5MBJ4_LEPOC